MICPMLQVEDKDFAHLKKVVAEYVDEVYPDKNFTFKVDSRRADKQYPIHSEQMNCDLGEMILKEFPQTRVDVHNPEVLLRVEIRKVVNIYSLMIPGPGECQWERMARQCCCCLAGLTVRWQDI